MDLDKLFPGAAYHLIWRKPARPPAPEITYDCPRAVYLGAREDPTGALRLVFALDVSTRASTGAPLAPHSELWAAGDAIVSAEPV
jgi:hypothetical protein